MFDTLSERLQEALGDVRSRGKLTEDDPRERQRRIPNKLNSAMVRAMGSDLLTVRVDLDP